MKNPNNNLFKIHGSGFSLIIHGNSRYRLVRFSSRFQQCVARCCDKSTQYRGPFKPDPEISHQGGSTLNCGDVRQHAQYRTVEILPYAGFSPGGFVADS